MSRFQKALRCQANNQKLEAAREYLGALQLHPSFFEAAFELGVLFQEMGQSDQAVGCSLAHAWGNLGVALRDTGHGQEAVDSFRQSLRLQPGEPDVLNNLGNALLAQQQYAEAIACFRDALRRTPANPGIHLNLGNALRASGHVAEAIQSIRQALELRPDFAEAHWDLAFALLLQGDFTRGFQENMNGAGGGQIFPVAGLLRPFGSAKTWLIGRCSFTPSRAPATISSSCVLLVLSPNAARGFCLSANLPWPRCSNRRRARPGSFPGATRCRRSTGTCRC